MKFYLGTNWKMSKTNSQARQFVTELLPLLRGEDLSKHYLFVIPSFTAVQIVRDIVSETGLPLNVGAQNVHWEDGVEATGEISARILADIPVDLVEIGHSERRQKFGETDADVNRKARVSLGQNLPVLICIGESGSDKQQGISAQVLETQIRAGLEGISTTELSKVMLAYEPTWAIGVAGQPADPSYVQEQHAAIRTALGRTYSAEIASEIPLLYGGSVNHQNFGSYAEIADVDGLFVGRAAWEPKSFIQLIQTSRQFIS
ncbi:MAG TPA: triose-phosphate isomerase [Terrimicrobiaceae bacterium]